MDLKGFSISSLLTFHFSLFTLPSSLFPSPSEEGECEATAKLQHFYSVTFTFIVKKDKHCKNCQIFRHFSFRTSFFPLLTLSFDFAVALLQSSRFSSSIELNVSFDFTEMPSPQR